ncbi:MAG TPA: serine hydrolase domain-containing protein [Vicinamibacterales bacterium]|nr:serine hydrolase domain-containing protein [Vicinamibacterales bacterium]
MRTWVAERQGNVLACRPEPMPPPGLQYVVVSPREVLADRHDGWSDLAGRAAMTSTTTQMCYSMSKTFTAAAVLLLVQAGRLALDDSLQRHVPMSPYGPDVTIRQLISHTGGLPNPIPLRWVHPAAAHATFDEAAALGAVLRGHPRLASPPGAKYRYSNIGYWLLGPLVEAVSGERFTDFVAGRVLRPLGIGPGELGYTIPDPARHAAGYLEKYSFFNLLKPWLIDRSLVGGYEGPWLRIASHYPNGPAFGGLVGSARAVAAFLQDQLRDSSSIFDAKTRALFFEPQQAHGAPVAMTLGWHIGPGAGGSCFFKEGGGGGFHSMMRVYPRQRLASVVMVNATGFDVRKFLDREDAAVLARTSA